MYELLPDWQDLLGAVHSAPASGWRDGILGARVMRASPKQGCRYFVEDPSSRDYSIWGWVPVFTEIDVSHTFDMSSSCIVEIFGVWDAVQGVATLEATGPGTFLGTRMCESSRRIPKKN